jgi:hypothetical protein
MRAVFGLVVLVASLASQSALADPIEPAAYPFLPQLTINNERTVCGSFESVVIEAFKGPDFQISIDGLEWPEVKVERLQFTDLGVHTSQAYAYPAQEFLGARIDRNGDGREEFLVQAAWEHSWRGNMNFLALYPDFSSFRQAKLLAEPETAPPVGERATIPTILAPSQDMTPGASSGTESTADAQSDDDVSSWKWTWTKRDVLKINGSVYVLDQGEVYDDDIAMTLWKIPPKGSVSVSCKVATFSDDRGFTASSLAPGSLGKLQSVLGAISGQEFAGGTLHAHERILMGAGRTAARISLRPWVVAATTEETRQPRDLALWIWSHASIWNYRQYQRLLKVAGATKKNLAKYYRDDFDLSQSTADGLAEVATESLISSFFIFRGEWGERIVADPALTEKLRSIILQNPRASLLEGRVPAAATSGSEEYDWRDWPGIDPSCFEEPRLFYALDHAQSLALLIKQGADVNEPNGFGKTALMYAAHLNQLESAKALIAAGADVNRETSNQDADGEITWNCYSAFRSIGITRRTALMYALENADPQMVGLLLDAGANPNARDSEGRGALGYLARNTALPDRERRKSERLVRDAGYADAASQP